jgi:hypothetical protein
LAFESVIFYSSKKISFTVQSLSVQSDWNGFLEGIRIWIEENPETIQLKKIGFTENWKDVLKIK